LFIFKNTAIVHVGTAATAATAATAQVLDWLLAGMEATMIPEALTADQNEEFLLISLGPKSINEILLKSLLPRLVFMHYSRS